MVKPKIDFKKLLLEKGEKIGIITALVIMVLLFVWAGFAVVTSKSKDTLAGDLDKKVSVIRSTMKGNAGEPQADGWTRQGQRDGWARQRQRRHGRTRRQRQRGHGQRRPRQARRRRFQPGCERQRI